MNLSRSFLLAGALLLAGTACATDVSMAGGEVTFSTPDNWVAIMETQGMPEMRVFQVPDPSPTARDNLASVTVEVEPVGDLAAFDQYVANATRKAKALDGYKAMGHPDGPNSQSYGAQEHGTAYRYDERYWFRNDHAIRLRCARPARSEAGTAWGAAFDKGCDAVAADLAR
ncbi:MAG TPA: hypothetical protein VFH59_12655 [Frateuria sp.]|uniref:hypothetical protein n=1 Tax=Frateuria sp. TaxID=2211372 RepID=UPI002D809349|nr:hypothetical protein [Frateuria sp.]HET6806281.1 hypothetical protein [Frateuria sp.]